MLIDTSLPSLAFRQQLRTAGNRELLLKRQPECEMPILIKL